VLSGLTPLQIVLAVVGVGFLIAWHEAGHYLVARLTGMRVLRYSLGFGPKVLSFEKNGIVYQIAALPLGGFVQIFGMNPLEEGAEADPRSFSNRPRWARFAVILAGPASNYLLASMLFFAFLAGWPGHGPGVAIDGAAEGSPAAAAGFLPGDLIVEMDGVAVESTPDLIARVQAAAGKAMSVVVVRGPEEARTRTTLTVAAKDEEGTWRLGVSGPKTELPALTVGEMARASVLMCVQESRQTLAAFASLFAGDGSVQLEGPVNIVGHITKAIERGARDLIWILALLSTTLGLLNLLPVPSLDGMKLLTIAVESVIRRDINPMLQIWVNAVGLVLLLGLMVVLTVVEGAQKIMS
jgi:regulator of sigma E protease